MKIRVNKYNIDYSIVDKETKVVKSFLYPSEMCERGEVHVGIKGIGIVVDMCVPYREAMKEIKKDREGKMNGNV